MTHAWSPEYDGRTDLDRDDPLVVMGETVVNYPDVLWMEDVAGASGLELHAESAEPREPSEKDREAMGQMVLLDAYREAQGEPEAA